MQIRVRTALAVAVAAVGLNVPAVLAGSTCPEDLDGSGAIDFGDLLQVLSNWGPCPGCPEDLDGDDQVAFGDLLQILSNWGPCPVTASFTATEIAGNELTAYPHFEYVQAFNENAAILAALDPHRFPVEGSSGLLFVTAPKTAADWDADPSLTDVRGAPTSWSASGPDIQDATVLVPGALDGDGGDDFGIGYDLVIDLNANFVLDDGDYIDGYGDVPGFHVVKDTTTNGPHATSQAQYSGGSFLGQRTYWPSDIASMGELPLVVISHGNGHQYTWYDYLGHFLASHGYVVMSHENNTVPGIESASTTTLTNTDYILGNLGTIAGGVLDGHVDGHTIAWFGHSRGGEGVARAYDRLFDSTYFPSNFDKDDIVLISSIAPTDFLGTNSANPHGVDYHLLYGAGDGDVSGAPNCDICQSFHLLERATGWRASTYVQGADHNDFNCCGFNDYDGPASLEIGRAEAQRVAKGAYLALLSHSIKGSIAAEDYLGRQYESIRPISVAASTVVDRELKTEKSGKFIIDDFQSFWVIGTSSSGGLVTSTVTGLTENRLNDVNTSFTWQATDPWNGMTRGQTSDQTRGCVFEFNGDSYLEFEIVADERDWTDDGFLAFRVAQTTRHPHTDAEKDFTVTLIDGTGGSSSIRIGAYGGGVEEPFARTGSGTGTGWQNEFETIRIRITDFLTNGSGIDLADVAALRFEFGPSFGSSDGRLSFDDIEIINN